MYRKIEEKLVREKKQKKNEGTKLMVRKEKGARSLILSKISSL